MNNWKNTKYKKYQVSKFGEIRNKKTDKILKPSIDGGGYYFVKLNAKNYKVHRLVAEAFLEIPEELKHLKGTRYLQVNHKDENKLNNRLENLEWCTAKYNNNYGTRKKRAGLKISKSLLNNEKICIPIIQLTKDGEFVREWLSSMQTEREGGFINGHINKCCRGKRKSHKGFIWKFKRWENVVD